MPKFRTKGETVEAIQWTGTNYAEVHRWVKSWGLGEPGIQHRPDLGTLQVSEGGRTVTARVWDYILWTGDQFAVRRPAEFEYRYEPAPPTDE